MKIECNKCGCKTTKIDLSVNSKITFYCYVCGNECLSLDKEDMLSFYRFKKIQLCTYTNKRIGSDEDDDTEDKFDYYH